MMNLSQKVFYVARRNLPNGFVKLIDVFGLRPEGRGQFSPLERPDYEVRTSGDVLSPILILCSNWETPRLKYVGIDQTFDHYTPAALEALTLRLSMFMAVKLEAGDKVGLVGDLYSNAKMNAIQKPGKTYEGLVEQISERYEQGRRSAAIAVNSHIVDTYWNVGRDIVEFEQHGSDRAAGLRIAASRKTVEGFDNAAREGI